MADKKLSHQDIRSALAKTLKETVEEYASGLRALRKREVAQAQRRGTLAKSELCVLCGNPDRPDTCTCLRKNLRKDGVLDQAGSSGGDAGMALGEMCAKCSKSHELGKCSMDDVKPGKELAKDLMSDIKPGKDLGKDEVKPARSAKAVRGTPSDHIKRLGTVPPPAPIKKDEVTPDKGKDVTPDKQGSGGEIKALGKSEKLQKDGTNGFKRPVASPKLPGVVPQGFKPQASAPTSIPGGGISSESANSIADAKAMQSAKPPVAKPGGSAASGEINTPPKPMIPMAGSAERGRNRAAAPVGAKAGPTLTAARQAPGAELKSDMKAGGVGWLNSIVSKLKGVGNKTWDAMRGAGPANAERANRTMGTRMALSEKPLKKSAPAFLGNCALCKCAEHPGSCTK